jgi:hypothetical protein
VLDKKLGLATPIKIKSVVIYYKDLGLETPIKNKSVVIN